jgi:hypothetical protein
MTFVVASSFLLILPTFLRTDVEVAICVVFLLSVFCISQDWNLWMSWVSCIDLQTGRSRSTYNLLNKNWYGYSNSWFAILHNLLVPMFFHFTKGTILLFQIHIFAKLNYKHSTIMVKYHFCLNRAFFRAYACKRYRILCQHPVQIYWFTVRVNTVNARIWDDDFVSAITAWICGGRRISESLTA